MTEETALRMVSSSSRLVNTLAASVILGCVAFVAWRVQPSQSVDELFQVT
jgi:hypothetical protein